MEVALIGKPRLLRHVRDGMARLQAAHPGVLHEIAVYPAILGKR